MSYSTLYVFREDGNAAAHQKYTNAFGAAARVWQALAEKYGRTLHPEGRLPFMMDLWKEIWKIEDVTAIPWWEHNVLHWTFDRALIRSQDVPIFIESMRRFETELPISGFSHLSAVAQTLEDLFSKGDAFLAIGFQHTSAAENAWLVYNQKTEEEVPYNILKDSNHYFVEVLAPK